MDNKPAIPQDRVFLDTSRFHHTRTGLIVHGLPSWNECVEHLANLRTAEIAVQLCIGDLLNFMEAQWGEDWTQAVDAFDYNVRSLGNMKSVARAFPPTRRRENIPYTYYQAIQGLSEEEQERLLDMVETENLHVRHLRNKVRALKGEKGEAWACIHNPITVCALCGEEME